MIASPQVRADVNSQAGMPSLLYVTPVTPALTGNGLAMRAGMVLEALASHHRVSVLVVPLYGSAGGALPGDLQKLCDHSEMVATTDDAKGTIEKARRAYPKPSFDILHVFRLSAMAFARPYMAEGPHRPRRHLDLDDVDSKTRRRIATLCLENGDIAKAEIEIAGARRSELLEAMAFRLFDRLYVCSEQDRRDLLVRSKAEICVLQNAVRPQAPRPPPGTGGVFRLLFVGTLSYYPNQDAVIHFCSRILPLIRKSATVPVEVDIVGGGASETLRTAASGAGAGLAGQVPHLEGYYERAHAVIVPIRAGGGTRIKILEAFSYCRPVITTSAGVEGIEARPNEHLLLGDTPEEFAACCVQLIRNPALAVALVENAKVLLSQAYSGEALKRAVACPATNAVLPGYRADAQRPSPK